VTPEYDDRPPVPLRSKSTGKGVSKRRCKSLSFREDEVVEKEEHRVPFEEVVEALALLP
jgi:hypothetical protein